MIFNSFPSHISFYTFPQIILNSHTCLINELEVLGFKVRNPFFLVHCLFSSFRLEFLFLPFYTYQNSTDNLRLSLYETSPLTRGRLQRAPTAITYCILNACVYSDLSQVCLIGGISCYVFSCNPAYNPSLSLVSQLNIIISSLCVPVEICLNLCLVFQTMF